MPEVSFWVPGIPQPQGSIQFKGMRRGKPILTSDNENLKPWRLRVWAQASLAAGMSGLHVSPDESDPAIAVEIHFVLARPKGHIGAKGVLASAPAEPIVRPDIDKLCRAVLDGLTEAGVFRDDSQVVRLLASKSYTTTAPGAAITVRTVQQPQPSVTPGAAAHGTADAAQLRRALG